MNTPVKKYILPSLRITAIIIKIKLRPASNLNKNLRSNLYSSLRSSLRSSLCSNLCSSLYNNLYNNNLCNNLDLQTVFLISSNSHPFLYKLLTSSRRFSVEKDFKTSIIPKVATKVATSII